MHYRQVSRPRRLGIVPCIPNSFYQVRNICYKIYVTSRWAANIRCKVCYIWFAQLINFMVLEKFSVWSSTISNNAYHLEACKLQHSYRSPNDIHKVVCRNSWKGKNVMHTAILISCIVLTSCCKMSKRKVEFKKNSSYHNGKHMCGNSSLI